MPAKLNCLRHLSNTLYTVSGNWVTGKLIRKSADPLEHARIRMLFDFLFFYSLALIPVCLLLIYRHDSANLLLVLGFFTVFFACASMMSSGVSRSTAGTVAALNTLIVPMISSFSSDLDVSPIYAIPWMMAVLLAYFAVNLRMAVALGVLLFFYLGLVAWMKISNIPVLLPHTYTAGDKYIATPFLMLAYLFVCLRVWGVYYRNISRLEHQQNIEKQQQFSALVNQNLTKQFILLKGLSRSGKAGFMDGDAELIDECFSEIEKQCDTAIHYLDGPKEDA